jgi:hypothetical protein
MQKARRHPTGLRPLVSVWFQVLFHSSVRGAFHLSLTVLVHYRSLRVFSLTRWSWQIHTGFHVSRATQDTAGIIFLTCTGLSPSMVQLSRIFHFENIIHIAVLQPRFAETNMVWALPRSIATTKGITICFLFLRVLRCFSSPGLLPITRNIPTFRMGCPIRKSTDQKVICTSP